jgi:hypothetical protein
MQVSGVDWNLPLASKCKGYAGLVLRDAELTFFSTQNPSSIIIFLNTDHVSIK